MTPSLQPDPMVQRQPAPTPARPAPEHSARRGRAPVSVAPRPIPSRWRWPSKGVLTLLIGLGPAGATADLPQTIATVKRSVVAVGTYAVSRPTQQVWRGTGFVVGGQHVVTNAHVLAPTLDAGRRETHAVFLPKSDGRVEMRGASLVRQDKAHDLALLRLEGPRLPGLRLATTAEVREGQPAAFTGYPILGALGLHAATHTGIVAALAPVVLPVMSGKDLKPEVLKRLGQPFDILQLDITAFPGNSGSPLFEPATGRVIGVINSVFIKGTKEVALTDPSGITYAIPVDAVRGLLNAAGVKF